MIILGKTWGDLGKSIAKNLGPHVFRGQSVFFVISHGGCFNMVQMFNLFLLGGKHSEMFSQNMVIALDSYKAGPYYIYTWSYNPCK